MQFDIATQLYENHFVFRFRPCYSHFFLSTYFLDEGISFLRKISFFQVSFWVKAIFDLKQFSTVLGKCIFLDDHLNNEISYLEVVSLPPLEPASLVIVSSSPPCSRRCLSCMLMSWLKAEYAILAFENHGLQSLLFATFAVLDPWLV